MDRIIGHIENMKQKPEHVRKRYAFLISFSVSFIILAGWIGSYSITKSPTLADKPVTSLTASVFDAFKDIKDIFVGTNQFKYSSESEVDIKPGNR